MAGSSMSKFRMKLKLQGFELEIEGNRQDASVIGRNIGDQISAMLSPAVSIVEGEISAESPSAAKALAAPLMMDSSGRPPAVLSQRREAHLKTAFKQSNSAMIQPSMECRVSNGILLRKRYGCFMLLWRQPVLLN